MYINKIVLENVRCFEKLTIDLSSQNGEEKWLMIVGDNGFGKTTILCSIAMGLCDETGAAALLQDTFGDWVRWGEKKATIYVELWDESREYSIETTIERTKAGLETVNQTTDLEISQWEEIFVCGYGANRSIHGKQVYDEYSAPDAVYTLFNYDYSLQSPELSLRRRAMSRDELDEVCDWLSEVLMLERESIELDEYGLKVKSHSDNYVYFGSLGDGHKGMLTLVLDMLGWGTLAGLKDQKNTLSGIVLIDELEQHLHPSWQKYICRLLHEVFPNVQFITTTHSAMCAIGTANLPEGICTLLMLRPEDDRIVGHDKVAPPRGQRADQVLTSYLFDLDTTRSDDTLQRIERLSTLMTKETRGETEEKELEALRFQLNREIGSAETELQGLVEKAVHETIDQLVAEISELKLSPEAISLEVRRRVRELFGKGKVDDQD